MFPKAEKERLKLLLKETLTLLCKNGLPYKSHFSLEALVGVTLDKKDVLLVSINENVSGSNQVVIPDCGEPKQQTARRGQGRRYGSPYKPNRLPYHEQQLVKRTSDGTTGGPGSDRPLTEKGQEVQVVCAQNTSQFGVDSTQIKEEIGDRQHLGFPGDDEDFSSLNDSDMDSPLDDSSADSDSGDNDKELQVPGAGPSADLSQAAQQPSGRKTRRKRKRSGKKRKSDLKLNPMGADETARIWAMAMANAREQKEPSPKKKPAKKRRSGDGKDVEDATAQSGDDKPEMPPMCHICGKQMSTEKNLTKHVRRHLGMFSVFCDECGKGFFDRTDLDAHSAKHANRKLYQCHICGRSYSHNRGLLKHIRKDHHLNIPGDGSTLGLGVPTDGSQPLALLPPPPGTPSTPHSMNPRLSQTDSALPPPTTSTYAAQPPGQHAVPMMQITSAADSQMSQTTSPAVSMSPQVEPPALSQALSQISPQMAHSSHASTGILPPPPHTPHLSHLRPDLAFPAGLHTMTEASYYFQSAYPSQSVFPGGSSH